AQSVLHHGPEAADPALAELRDIADPGHLFVELQHHGFPEQPVLNGILAEAAARMGLPIVATNDVHYAHAQDAEAQLMLNCIHTGTRYSEAKVLHHGSKEMYLKSPEQMAARFSQWPQALQQTLAVAEMCGSWKLVLGESTLPTFDLPEGQDTTTYFIKVAMDGLQQRFDEYRRIGKPVDESAYRQRLEREISVIVEMQFPGYFLIVWDFIRFAKQKKIPVGPGRGSGAGSLVAYAMRITDLDPMPYNLLFERFLNPERVSMPDFDIDFCMDRRDEVIRYVTQKYGADSVGQIAAFHELKARSVIKDVGRSLGVSAQDTQKLASLVPDLGQGKTATIPQALEIEPKLKAIWELGGIEREVLEQAQRLEGLTRHIGMHAAGVVISNGPLWDTVPAFRQGDTLITQYNMSDVEQAGLVKFDFLGLRTLTVIDETVRRVNMRPDRQGKEPLDINQIPMDDGETFALLQLGETIGVFQLESSGMQNLFKKLRPDCFEDIIAAVALYRPGPLESGMVDQFVACKHGRQLIKKMHPLIDGLLQPTYGVIVYQEQVMQIAQKLANYSLGGADLLRRAMGKKKKEEMDKQTDLFLQGARDNGVDEHKAKEIFELVAQFAKYGFNRSHSAGYALLTYQTAYLKAHYPAEFLCALMTADREKTEKVVRIIDEGRAMGVQILPPDINGSDTDFKVVYGSPDGSYRPTGQGRLKDPLQPMIRFGLGAVRGVGDAALEGVFEVRKNGDFKDIFDFCSRVDVRKLNRGVLESLVQSGAFDSTLKPSGVSRAQALASIDVAMERGRSASKDRERGQTTLFGLFDAAVGSTTSSVAEYPDIPSWDLRESCIREKQSLGFYLSSHPLDRYGRSFEKLGAVAVESLVNRDPWAEVRLVGMVESYREKIFKGGGGKSALFDLEDKTGKVTAKVRESQIDKHAPILTSAEPVVVTGKLRFPESSSSEEPETTPQFPMLLLDSVEFLSKVIREEARGIELRLPESQTTEEMIRGLGDVLKQSPGKCPVMMVLRLATGEVHLSLPTHMTVEPDERLFTSLERLFGHQVAELR
ncbi:MAG TPA: DNA polymerase III subunit alpha, partial [Polyangiaceae bacterium]|nr:DNA polymerase III subunit alpha [Polyangiaceae bacterium]